MTGPAISGPISEPHASQYTPTKLAPSGIAKDVEAVKELLGWLRFKGLRVDLVQVGSIRLVGVVDDYPRKAVLSTPSPSPAGDLRLFEDD